MNKKIIILISIVILVVVAFCIASSTWQNDIEESSNNNNFEVNKISEEGITKLEINQKIDGLVFSNVVIKMLDSDKCEITADVLNTKKVIEEAHTVRLKLTDDATNLNEVFAGSVPSILSNSTGTFAAIVRKNLTGASNAVFEIIE